MTIDNLALAYLIFLWVILAALMAFYQLKTKHRIFGKPVIGFRTFFYSGFNAFIFWSVVIFALVCWLQ